jgi:hypothetical protein
MIGGMTPPLPLPVRVAAGLVVTAVEQARDLPRLALELPVTAVSQALQASMRVQQKVTELALKGDRVLGTGTPIEDEPAWATFDDDLPPRRNGADAGGGATVTTLRAAPDPFDDAAPIDAAPFDAAPVDPVPMVPMVPEPVPPITAPTAPAVAPTDSRPDVLPGYAGLSIPQLRGKLRHLGVDDLRALLAWEQAHGDRPPYVTMLTNRIATVTET